MIRNQTEFSMSLMMKMVVLVGQKLDPYERAILHMQCGLNADSVKYALTETETPDAPVDVSLDEVVGFVEAYCLSAMHANQNAENFLLAYHKRNTLLVGKDGADKILSYERNTVLKTAAALQEILDTKREVAKLLYYGHLKPL